MNKAPDAFRTISEVAAELDLPQHVLRFWESRFPQIRPMKRGGGRRYYRPDDVELLRGIRHLLYGQGYTIRGVQRILREQGPRFVQTVWQEGAPQPERLPEVEADEREDAGIEDEPVAPRPADRAGEEFASNEVAEAPQRREPSLTEAAEDASVAGNGAMESPQTAADRNEQPEQRLAEPERAGELLPVDRDRLQSVLETLDACKRLLDDAFAEAEQSP
ncbi:MAG: MerR family transcriptional regulator [Rhodoplanes sp.]|nr:MerR family transcriptional regulator [Rhodoplanes sp.]